MAINETGKGFRTAERQAKEGRGRLDK